MVKKLKVALIIMVAIFTISVFTSTVMGADSKINSMGWETQITDIDTKSGTEYGADMDTGKVDSLMGKIVSVVRIIAIGVAIIMISVLAMKYLMAAPSDKADIKKHAVVYVVGAVVLFGASGILGIIIDFSKTVK